MDDLKQLRELLLDEERAVIDRLRQRIDVLERHHGELPARFPGLLLDGLGDAVRSERHGIVDALFPVIGPAIRKAIAEATRDLVDGVNTALESSFTLRGLRWRVEAWRSGVPYAHVALKHTLAYQIDHMFLIEVGSGLVLYHAAADGLPDLDADAVAGMLTAIGAFVTDSFGGSVGDTLEAAQVGEHLVWVMGGPRANLVCFIRGAPPARLRAVLVERLETIHARHQSGAAPLQHDELRQELYPHAIAQTLSRQQAPARKRSRLSIPLLLVMAAALVLGGWQAWQAWQWHAGLATLRADLVGHAGFVLQHIDERRDRAVHIHGLLDADAPSLQPLLDGAQLRGVTPVVHAAGYLSSDDEVVQRRARRLLDVPDTVVVDVSNGHLTLAGRAPEAWIGMAGQRAPWIAGVGSIAIDLEVEADHQAAALKELQEKAADLGELVVRFSEGVRADAAGEEMVEELAAGIAHALQREVVAGVRLDFEVTGMNDPTGGEEINRQRREQRAGWLVAQLVDRGIPASRLRTTSDAASRDAGDVRGARVTMYLEPAG